MKIENFDTGLKGQKDIKNIIISPEENYNNKKKVREYLKNIVHHGPSKLDDNLNSYFSDDVKVNCFHPVNEFIGIENRYINVKLENNFLKDNQNNPTLGDLMK